MAGEIRDQAAVEGDAGEVVVDRAYTCKFCNKNFDNYQAYGGHQNAHRTERASIRRLQRDAELLAMPPPPWGFPSSIPATHHQAFMFPQPPHRPLFRPPHHFAPYPTQYQPIPQRQYFHVSPSPFRPSFQPFLHPFRGANPTFSSSSFSHVAASASRMRAPYQFGGGMRREEDRSRNMNYKYCPMPRAGAAVGVAMMARAGAPVGEATMARPPSSYFGSRGSNGRAGRGELVEDDNENELELTLRL